MNKRSLWILSVAVVALAATFLVRSNAGMGVDAEPVTRGLLRVTTTEEGRTRVRERYTLAAPTTGRLERIVLREGDAVQAGDVLAVVYPAEMDTRTLRVESARLSAAEANRSATAAQLERARAALDQVRREYTRGQALAADSIISAQELEHLRLGVFSGQQDVAALEASLLRTEAEVQALRASLSGGAAGGMVLRAPADGRVLRVLEKSERVVPAGTPVMVVGNSAGLEVIVDVLSEDAVRIAPGDSVLLDEWGGDDVLYATVRLVEPDAFTKISALGVEEQRVNVIADVHNPPPSLGSGYAVRASIVLWSSPNELRVPTSALFRHETGWQVFVVENGGAERRNVSVGRRGQELAQVLEGLQEGDLVVVYPPDDLEGGASVVVRE